MSLKIEDMNYDDVSSALVEGGNVSLRDYFDEGPDVDWWESYRHELEKGLFYDVHTHGSHREGSVHSITLDTSNHRDDHVEVNIETAMADPGHVQHRLAKSVLTSMKVDTSDMISESKVNELSKRVYKVDGKTLHEHGILLNPDDELLSFVSVESMDFKINKCMYEFSEGDMVKIRDSIGGYKIGLSCDEIMDMMTSNGVTFED